MIVFDNNAVNAIGDSDVSLPVKVFTENLPENVPENAELALEVSLVGATLENGTATVTVPFEKRVPAGKVAKVYYVDGDEITVSEYTANDKYYIFTLDNIQQDQLNSEITATLYATYNDTLVSGDSMTATIFDFGTQGCDINGDGSVDIRDFVRLKKLMCNAPISEESDDVVDPDFSGTLDALDLVYIRKMLLLA
ncbi:MAG: dockerin type I repeat-containing protein [Clostridia bacterium]|nr:dockerin type I repeat-containing protein [Clostridia bacterium]